MADGVKISSLTEATDAQMTDAGLIETAVSDTGSSTGFSSKKASLSRLAGYILNKFSGLSLAGSTQTVKSAFDSLNGNLTNLSSGTILDYVKSQVAAGVPEGHFVATQNVSDIPASGTGWFVHYTKNIGSNIVQLKAIQYNDSRVIYNTHIGNYQSSTAFAREWTQEPTASEIGSLSSLTTTAKTNLVAAINEAASSGGGGMTEAVKAALLQLARKVAYIDDDGSTYYQTLYDALYPPANLVSISAVYTQSGTVYETDSIDSLKANLVVTATYSNASTETITTYALSGTLTVGTSTIIVSYGGKTTTFNVTVTHNTQEWVDGVPYSFEWIENKYITLTGTEGSYNNWDASPFLSCAGAGHLKIHNGFKNVTRYNAFYNENQEYLSNFSVAVRTTAGAVDTIEVPSTAAYFRVSRDRTSTLGDGTYTITPTTA